jgi:integrase
MRNPQAEELRHWFIRGRENTRNKNAIKLLNYCLWIHKSPEELKQEYISARTKGVDAFNEWRRNTQNNILDYYNYLKKKGSAINTCRSEPLGVLAFYRQNCEPLSEVTKEFDPVQIPENEYVFTQEVLRKMYFYGSPFEKTWLSCAVAWAYGSADFLEVETEKIANLVKEAKDKHLDFLMFIGHTRQKTSLQPRSFLTPECISNLSEYLESLKRKYPELPKYLWNGATNDNLNDWLRALMKKSDIETYGKQVRFHSLRKFLYDILSNRNETIAKIICAKKTNVSDTTYKPSFNMECERVFRECYKEFALNGELSQKAKKEQEDRLERLESSLMKLEAENESLRTRHQNLRKYFKKLAERFEMYEDMVKDLLKEKEKS